MRSKLAQAPLRGFPQKADVVMESRLRVFEVFSCLLGVLRLFCAVLFFVLPANLNDDRLTERLREQSFSSVEPTRRRQVSAQAPEVDVNPPAFALRDCHRRTFPQPRGFT